MTVNSHTFGEIPIVTLFKFIKTHFKFVFCIFWFTYLMFQMQQSHVFWDELFLEKINDNKKILHTNQERLKDKIYQLEQKIETLNRSSIAAYNVAMNELRHRLDQEKSFQIKSYYINPSIQEKEEEIQIKFNQYINDLSDTWY